MPDVVPSSFQDLTKQFVKSVGSKGERFSRFWNYSPIPKLMASDGFFASPKKVQVICGANRSGKSFAGTFKAVMIFTGIIPPAMRGVYAHENTLRDIAPGGSNARPRHVRIIVQDYTKHWPETIKPILLSSDYGMLPEEWSDYDDATHMFTGPDGSYLSIFACDPHEKTDPNTLRGAHLDHTWIDELTNQTVFTESVVRSSARTDGPKSVDLTFCPQEGFVCWTYERLYKSNYRAGTKQKLPPERINPDINVSIVTMRDNPSISEVEIKSQMSILRPWEIAYRVNGEYSQRAANPFFDMELLVKWHESGKCSEGLACEIINTKVDEERGIFEGYLKPFPANGTPDEMMTPVIRVWAAPKHGHKYLVTADLSEAGPDSDPQSVSVWDATEKWKPVQAAHLYTRRVRPGELGILAAILTKIYGGENQYALLVPEKNSTGGGMFIERVRNHWNLYRRTTFGKVDQEETVMLGWSTDAFSKGPMLEDAYRMLGQMGKENHCPVNSEEMLLQLMAYEERIKADVAGRTKVDWGHKPGTHDDCVTDFCIGMRVIKHEHEKLTTCKLEKAVVASRLQSLRKFEKRANQDRNGRGVSSHKAPSIQDLKRKFGGPRHA